MAFDSEIPNLRDGILSGAPVGLASTTLGDLLAKASTRLAVLLATAWASALGTTTAAVTTASGTTTSSAWGTASHDSLTWVLSNQVRVIAATTWLGGWASGTRLLDLLGDLHWLCLVVAVQDGETLYIVVNDNRVDDTVE